LVIVGDHRKPIHDRNNFSSERRPRSASCHLATDAIEPWQHQSWIFISDPDFALKAGRVLDLYAAAYSR